MDGIAGRVERAPHVVRMRQGPRFRESIRRFSGWPGVCSGSLKMRLVTYDRRGHRRLGAILDGRVVDLPDAVGHPAFPTTLEAFVQSSRGTVLDAARAALAREDVMDHVVKRARILPPLFPRSLLDPLRLPGASPVRTVPTSSGGSPGPSRRSRGRPAPPGSTTSRRWPRCSVSRRPTWTRTTVQDHVFGYTLVSDWVAKDASGDPLGTSEGVPLAIGPCVVTRRRARSRRPCSCRPRSRARRWRRGT